MEYATCVNGRHVTAYACDPLSFEVRIYNDVTGQYAHEAFACHAHSREVELMCQTGWLAHSSDLCLELRLLKCSIPMLLCTVICNWDRAFRTPMSYEDAFETSCADVSD